MPHKWTARIGAFALIATAAAVAGYQAGAQDEADEPAVRTLKVNEVARIGERVLSAEEFIQRIIERERYITDPDQRTAQAALTSLLADELLMLEAERLDASPKQRETRAEKESLEKLERETLETTNEYVIEQQKALGKEPVEITWEEWLDRKYGMTAQQYSAHILTVARQNLTRRLVIHFWADATEHADAQGIFMRSKNDLAEVRTRIIKGEKFSLLAREHSEDMWTREHDGNIGTAWPNDGSLEDEVAEAFWELDEGEVSHIIATYRGFWIVKRAKNYPANEAAFYDRRAELFGKPNVKPDLLLKWQRSTVADGRYAFERRVPGWDCEADRP